MNLLTFHNNFRDCPTRESNRSSSTSTVHSVDQFKRRIADDQHNGRMLERGFDSETDFHRHKKSI